jgi:hypothetical protein
VAEPERFRFQLSKATISPDRLVTFSSPISKTRFYVEDIQRIERKEATGEGYDSWEIVFIGGSRSLQGNAGKKLALRLCQLNPNIRTNFDRIAVSDEGKAVWWAPTGVYPDSFRAEAVRQVRQNGRTIPDVATQMRCPVEALRLWVKAAEMDEVHRLQNEASYHTSGPGRLIERVLGWFVEKTGSRF